MQTPPDMPLKWMFLDLNSYFASVEQQINPALRGKPVAVVPLDTDSTCAIAASYEAKAYGIKTGTRIYEAKQMCPDLICVKADHEHYVDFHHKIIEEIEHYIPVAEVGSIDEVAMELSPSEADPAVARALAQRIRAGIYRNIGESIGCSIGIAPNRFLAKIATNLQKPNGLVVIEQKDIPHRLYDMKIGDLYGFGKAMEHRLYRNGVGTVEQLYQLDPKHMRAIWHSVEGERMWYKLRGYQISQEPTTRRSLGHSNVLAPENRPVAKARLVCHRLLLKAASRLRREGYHATSLEVGLRLEDRNKVKIETRFKPKNDNPFFTSIWSELWELAVKKADLRYARIMQVSVTLGGMIIDDEVQPDLFDLPEEVHQQKKNEAISKAMDDINKRFGRNTLTTADTLGDANLVTGTKIAFRRIPDKDEFRE